VTSPDPRAVAAQIKAETGIDLLDSNADAAGATAATRRAWRQVAGTFGGSLASGLGLLGFVLAFAPGNLLGVLRVAFAYVGVVSTAAAIALIIWGWRTPPAYAELYLRRQQAFQRFFIETRQPRPSLFVSSGWFTRKP